MAVPALRIGWSKPSMKFSLTCPSDAASRRTRDITRRLLVAVHADFGRACLSSTFNEEGVICVTKKMLRMLA